MKRRFVVTNGGATLARRPSLSRAAYRGVHLPISGLKFASLNYLDSLTETGAKIDACRLADGPCGVLEMKSPRRRFSRVS